VFNEINNKWDLLKKSGKIFLIASGITAIGLFGILNTPIDYQMTKNSAIQSYQYDVLKSKSDLKTIDTLNVKVGEPIVIVLDNDKHAENVFSIIETRLNEQLPQFKSSNNMLFINKILSIDDKNSASLSKIVEHNYNISNISMLSDNELKSKVQALSNYELSTDQIIDYFGKKYPNNKIYINMSYGEKTTISPDYILNHTENVFSGNEIHRFEEQKKVEYNKIFKSIEKNPNVQLIISAGNNQEISTDVLDLYKTNAETRKVRDYLQKIYLEVSDGDNSKFEILSHTVRNHLLSGSSKYNSNNFIEILQNTKGFEKFKNTPEHKELIKALLRYSAVDLNSDYDKYILLKSMSDKPELLKSIHLVEAISPITFGKNYNIYNKLGKTYPIQITLMAKLPDEMNMRNNINFKEFIKKYKEKYPELFLSSYNSLTYIDLSNGKTLLGIEGQAIINNGVTEYFGGTSASAPDETSDIIINDYQKDSLNIRTNNKTYFKIVDDVIELL
jgi:hypothetical protein